MKQEFIDLGEYNLLLTLKNLPMTTVFDVGSNWGEWSEMCHEIYPNSIIHTFEIIPDTYHDFVSRVNLTNIIPNSYGLFDKIGYIDVNHIPEWCLLSSAVTTFNKSEQAHIRSCLVITGDEYVKHNNITHIDFLKLDVEGVEHLVLRGFKDTLAQNKISVIQFEYGRMNISTRFLLIDFYELLTPLGFKIGLMTPDGILLRDYNMDHETLTWSNFAAIHESVLPKFQQPTPITGSIKRYSW